jgi:hypothetical protein
MRYRIASNCIWRLDRPALALIVFDDQREQIEAIAFRRARLWLVFEVSLDLLDRVLIVGLWSESDGSFFSP